MKTAIILFNEKNSSDIYLDACTDYAYLKEYIPIHGTTRKGYSLITEEFITRTKSITDTYIIFIDKGITDVMLNVVKNNPPEKLNIRTIIPGTYSLESIKRNVSERCKISMELMEYKSRKKEIVFARKCFYMEAKKHTKESLAKIGQAVNKDHATVLHGLKDMENTVGLKDEYEYTMGYKKRPEKKIIQPPQPVENKAILIGKSPIKINSEPLKKESKYKDIIPANNQPYHGYRVHQL
jgi:hypothetical protein